MPVNFLSDEQRSRYASYPNDLSETLIEDNFFLDDQDFDGIDQKRTEMSRLGYALQLVTVRFLGIFLRDISKIPLTVVHRVATQLKINAYETHIMAYQRSEQRWRHAVEIRTYYDYTEFVEKNSRFRLGRRLCTLCWTGTDRPSVLFEEAINWLCLHKILLPGVTILERFISEIRSRMEKRLWRLITKNMTRAQKIKLNQLLVKPENERYSLLEKLRKSPVRYSGAAFVKALERVEMARNIYVEIPFSCVPRARIDVLTRFANTAKVTAISRLPLDRKIATLVAFAHHLKATSQDDALDIFGLLLSELFSMAKSKNNKTRLRTIKDLDRSTATLIEACKLLLNQNIVDNEVRHRIYMAIGENTIIHAVNDASALIRPPDDLFYKELEQKKETVKRFLPTLLRVMNFEGNKTGEAVIQALNWLKTKKGEPPLSVVQKAWKRYVFIKDENNKKKIDLVAYTFCTLNQLQTALNRRDVFINSSWRYADPRANLYTQEEWDSVASIVCRSLDLTKEAQPTLDKLSEELDQTYKRVMNNWEHNAAVRFDNNGELILSSLDKLEEPLSLILLREKVKSRMPPVDLPEMVMEIAMRTGFIEAFTHITENNARVADLDTSICAVLLAQACNTGLEPFVREDIPALKRDRLLWIDQNYIRDDTLTTANAILVAAQNKIELAQKWGGGDVASADGMRFVVAVRTINAAPNPKYFPHGRGLTWYNLLSNQRTGLNSITVPGTLRDSLIILAVVLEQKTELDPIEIMTDTGAYSDVVFGLFRLIGLRFAPRLADLGGARFWRIDPSADYGPLNNLSKHRIHLDWITPNWDDILRLTGSLKLGKVPATGIMRTLQIGDKPTSLARAIAEIGRIDKTIHMLNYIDDESRRRATLLQLNLVEGRHMLAAA